MFRRAGRKVHGAGWQHDGSSPGVSKLSYGNCFVTAGIMVRLPFCSRAVCLPVLARLHLPGKKKGEGPSKADTAAALVTTDPAASPGALAARYADRWATGQVFADARNVLGAGEARNRAKLAAGRTVPFALLVHTLIIICYTRHGHDPAGIDDRRAAQPWYRTKTEPAFEDMLIKLRRTPIAARFSGSRPAQPTSEQIRTVRADWCEAAA